MILSRIPAPKIASLKIVPPQEYSGVLPKATTIQDATIRRSARSWVKYRSKLPFAWGIVFGGSVFPADAFDLESCASSVAILAGAKAYHIACKEPLPKSEVAAVERKLVARGDFDHATLSVWIDAHDTPLSMLLHGGSPQDKVAAESISHEPVLPQAAALSVASEAKRFRVIQDVFFGLNSDRLEYLLRSRFEWFGSAASGGRGLVQTFDEPVREKMGIERA